MSSSDRLAALQSAIVRGEAAAIAGLIFPWDFTLIEDWEEGMAEENQGGMVVEVDGWLVAFT
ncbi:MAG TPA: hypothetical protein VFB80_05440, partial [Pirellulaceae bacterium]|nr:hypothetical protein [Pirellulaceae bacterium]